MKRHEVQLEELIRNLEAERGIGGKVRLLAGSWPLVRELSPRQRERVALAVGSRWAWRNLEGMFGHPDKLSETQLQAKAIFEKMHDADPDELRKLRKEIKKSGLAGARSHLLGALGSALEERIAVESDAEHPDQVGSQAVKPGRKPESTRRKPAAAVPAPPWLPADLLDGLNEQGQATEQVFRRAASTTDEPTAAAADSKAPDPEGPELNRSAREPERPDVEFAPEPPRPLDTDRVNGQPQEPVASAPDDPPAPEPGEKATPVRSDEEIDPSPAESSSALEVPPATPQENSPGSRRRDIETLTAIESLRTLRRLSTGADVSSRSDREALVSRLGSGWAARRAVSAMIRLKTIADLDEALAIVRRLPTATQQSWCLGDILQHWHLDNADRERVLAAAPTTTAKRRLSHRITQSRPR